MHLAFDQGNRITTTGVRDFQPAQRLRMFHEEFGMFIQKIHHIFGGDQWHTAIGVVLRRHSTVRPSYTNVADPVIHTGSPSPCHDPSKCPPGRATSVSSASFESR